MLPGSHRQVHERASGWAIYWYAWRGGPQIARFAGETLAAAQSAELDGAAEIAEGYARERRPRPATGTVAAAIVSFMSPENPEWAGLAHATKVAWGRWLEIAQTKWGHLSGAEFCSDETAAEVRKWRDDLALVSPSNADKAMEAIARLCSYGGKRNVKLLPKDGWPTEDVGKVYIRPVKLPPARREVLAAIASLPPLASAICDIALHSGLRRSDMVRLSDPQIDEAAGIIRLGTKKGARHGRVAVIDLTPPLLAAIRRAQAIRDARYAELMSRPERADRSKPPKPLTVIVNTRCRAFTANGLYQHVRDAFEAIERERINPHSWRRASATAKFLSGMSWAKIGRELGWSEKEAEAMGAIYAPDEARENQG